MPYEARRPKLDLPRFGTAEVRLHEHLRGPLPETGLLVARVRNRPRINRVANHLGAIRPHFFALYHTPEMGSLALIHPQTGLVDAPCPDSRIVMRPCPHQLLCLTEMILMHTVAASSVITLR